MFPDVIEKRALIARNDETFAENVVPAEPDNLFYVGGGEIVKENGSFAVGIFVETDKVNAVVDGGPAFVARAVAAS